MKTMMSAVISACVLFAASATDANAQQSAVPANYVVTGSTIRNTGSAVDANLVNSNAVRTFNNKYKGAQDVLWSVSGQTTSVDFRENDVKMRATFNEKGALEYTIRYFFGSQIPASVRSMMKRDQYFMNITQVIEVRRNNQTTQFVKMENEISYVTVRVQNGETETFEEITKSK